MKRLLKIALAAPFLLMSVGALAGDTKGVEFSISGGLGAPVGDFGDFAKQGLVASASIGYSPSERFTFGMGLLGDFGTFDAKNVEQIEGAETNAGMNLLGASSYVSYAFGDDDTRLYALSGLGIMRFKAAESASDEELKVEVSASETKVYTTDGLGVDIAVGDKAKIFVQGMFNIGFTTGAETIWLSAQAGLRFRL
jgi:hypothetical protein